MKPSPHRSTRQLTSLSRATGERRVGVESASPRPDGTLIHACPGWCGPVLRLMREPKQTRQTHPLLNGSATHNRVRFPLKERTGLTPWEPMRPPAFGFRLSRVPASALLAVLLLWAFSAGTAWSQPYEITPASRKAIPDLNQLQERVLEFWSLVSRGEKYQALGYVAEGQDHFLNWKWPSVQSYRVANLELKDGSGEVVVTIQATTQAPGFETTINWPVRQRWAFREDAWRILVQGSNLAALFGGTSPGPAKPSPDQAETLQQLKLFQIGRQRIHFGEVLQGDVVWQEIFYKNESGIEINARGGRGSGLDRPGPEPFRSPARGRRDATPGCIYGAVGG